MTKKIKLGEFGESIAKKYLINKGYQILATNYRRRVGEIDIVCQKEEELIFVEVKTRKSLSFGWPELAITDQKKQHLTQAISEFLKTQPKTFKSMRIDAISIRIDRQNKISLGHIQNIVQDLDFNQ